MRGAPPFFVTKGKQLRKHYFNLNNQGRIYCSSGSLPQFVLFEEVGGEQLKESLNIAKY